MRRGVTYRTRYCGAQGKDPPTRYPARVRDLRFIFLGTGTSTGIPVIACRCPVCLSQDPRDTRLRTGAALKFTDDSGRPRTILLDATPDLRQQALRHNITRCDALLFTHHHVDHIFGLDEVRRFNVTMQSAVDIYAEPETAAALQRVYQHIFDAKMNANSSFVANLITHRIAPGTPIDLFGLRITPIRLLHGRTPIVGFRIDDLSATSGPGGARGAGGTGEPGSPLPMAYCTDVSGIPPESWKLLGGLETLVLDALRLRHHPTHYNLTQAVEVAERIGASRTFFVHMTHEIMHAHVEERLPETISLAHDGLILGDLDAERAGEPPAAFATDATKDDDFRPRG